MKKENIIKEDSNKSVYIIGIIFLIITTILTISDIFIGSAITKGDLTNIPQTAIEHINQINNNVFLGLYNLDLLNLINTIFMIPIYFIIYKIHNETKNSFIKLSLIFFTIGVSIFIINNAALPMLDISNKYIISNSEIQKNILITSGETILLKGVHGSHGVFPGFAFLSIANIILSFGMLRGKIFGKLNSLFGIISGILLSIYLIIITFITGTKTIAIMIAAPGGILSIIWMIMTTIKLIKLLKNK